MKTVLYANDLKKAGTLLAKKIQEELSEIELETLNSIESLVQRLCRPLNGISVIVIIISTGDELTGVLDLMPFFEHIRVILVLSHRDDKTMGLALQLNPSFIGFIDDDPSDITAVLIKIQKGTKEK